MTDKIVGYNNHILYESMKFVHEDRLAVIAVLDEIPASKEPIIVSSPVIKEGLFARLFEATKHDNGGTE